MMSEVRVSPSSSSSSSSNGADEEATRASRRSPVLPRAAVCRNLFGSPERGEVEKEVKETLAALAEDCKRRWNFDFEAERPLRGRYEWEAMDATTVAGVYRTRPSANKNGGNHNNHLGPVSNDGSDPRGAAESRTARSTRPTPRGAVDRTSGGGGHAGSDSFTATFTTTTAATTTTTTTTTANNNTNNTGGNTGSSNNETGDPFGTKGGDLPDESRGEEDGRGSGKGSPSTAADAAAASGGGGGSPAASPGRARGDGTSAGVEATNGSHSPSGSHGRTRETPEACHRQKRGSAPLTEYFPKRKKSDGSPPHPPDL